MVITTEDKIKKGIVIAGFGGVGKTMLAKKYKNVLDLESTPFKYLIEDYDKLDAETIKGTQAEAKKLNPDFPSNYITAIKNNINKYDYILVWCHPEEILPHFDANGVDYQLFIPTRDALDEYRQRFIDRGNNEDYVNRVSDKDGYDKRLLQFKATGKPIIFLGKGETLESYIKNHEEYPLLNK